MHYKTNHKATTRVHVAREREDGSAYRSVTGLNGVHQIGIRLWVLCNVWDKRRVLGRDRDGHD